MGRTVMVANVADRAPVAEPPARVRVLNVHSGNLYGGVETFLRTAALHRDDARPVTLEFALCFGGRVERELRAAGATVHLLEPVRLRSPRSVWAARRALARLLRAGGYDAVVCHSLWSHALFGPVVRRAGSPLVYYMHDVANAKGWLDHLANLRRPDLVVANSLFTQRSNPWLFRGTPRRLVRYPSAFTQAPVPSDREAVRAALGVAPGAIVILQASRMQPWKGQHLLVAALAELREHPRWTCWLAGGAQRPSELAYETTLRAEVARAGLVGRVKFLGQRDDVPALMRAADIHCQPNAGAEPFGLVFVEALAAGLPVVATDMGGPKEILDATCGVLVAPEGRAVAAALRELVDDDIKRARLSEGGPARARLLCDPKDRMNELGAALASLAGGRDGHVSRGQPS